MKLLFDQNLSPKLSISLADVFPGSMHVQSVSLDCADDYAIWEFARQSGFAIVTKDEDFNNLGVLRGCPPKVIWLQTGNCATKQVESLLRIHHVELVSFDADSTTGTIVLS